MKIENLGNYEIHKCVWFGFDLIINDKMIAWGKSKQDVIDMISRGLLVK